MLNPISQKQLALYIYLHIYLIFNRLFRAVLGSQQNGKYCTETSFVPLAPPHAQSPIITIPHHQSGDPTLIHHYTQRRHFTSGLTLGIACSLGLNKGVMYLPLSNHAGWFHCPKNPLLPAYSSFPQPPAPGDHRSFHCLHDSAFS